jgi:hypothetical protein
MTTPQYTLTNESITVILKGKPTVVKKGAPNFAAIRSAIIDERWDDIEKHLTVQKSLHEWAKGKFTLNGNNFFYEGQQLPSDINRRIIQMATNGEDPTPLLKFYERLQQNPSYRSVHQLYSFLSHQGIPIRNNGFFLAYKGVKDNFKDAHSGKFDNSPGNVHEMPRNQISDDPKEACHEGFHVGALRYAKGFSQRVVVCEVDPADVVCVPYDSSSEKMRVCKYRVVGNHNGELLPDTTIGDEDLPEVEPVEAKKAEEPEIKEEEEDTDDYTPENDLLAETCEECETKVPQEQIENDGHWHADTCVYFKPKAKVTKPAKPVKKASEEEIKNEGKEIVEKRSSKKGFAKFDKMPFDELMKQSLDDLRQYAGKGLEIVGASKIPGGKTALVHRILEVRKD